MQVNLFRAVGRSVGLVLSAQRKAAIQEWLINKYRIPVSWQPRPELQQKFKQALELLDAGDEPIGDYLEFGVYQGNSMICMHRAMAELGSNGLRLFGFDSFEGLPESAKLDGVWSKGQFRSEIDFTRELLTGAGINWQRTKLIQGFYDAVLNPELAQRLEIERVSVIMIDCDLYSSTREALAFCAPLLADHCIIFFDDWESTGDRHGEKKAFAEFLSEHDEFEVSDLGGYHSGARVAQLVRRSVPGTEAPSAPAAPMDSGSPAVAAADSAARSRDT